MTAPTPSPGEPRDYEQGRADERAVTLAGIRRCIAMTTEAKRSFSGWQKEHAEGMLTALNGTVEAILASAKARP